MTKRTIPYYRDFLSDRLLRQLRSESSEIEGVLGLRQVGSGGGLESKEAFRFLCELYDQIETRLAAVLTQRIRDRRFFDQRTRACHELNKSLRHDFGSKDYVTVLGERDAEGRIVVGPRSANFCQRGGKKIAPLTDWLQGEHVTLFGPPDDAKLSINAMNAFHRKIKNEPAIIGELLDGLTSFPKWGADDEDSKTPLRRDLIDAGVHLSACFDRSLSFVDPSSGKQYALEKDRLSLPIKRFPGLALPCPFLLYRDNPMPLHLYDFALHFFRNWNRPEALAFYVPKLENEEEAAYIHSMMASAEALMQKRHPEYRAGSVRLFIVLENPRAIFRAHEIIDALHPFFAGASLGWHDYLASTARLFKNDANYRIPVKADPDIVIKYIKASHELLADVVGSRGGVKIGGMYGILPASDDRNSPSFQVTIKGFIKDVVTQMKRDLSGFWVAHPDFVRIGMALVEAWRIHKNGDPKKLKRLVDSLLTPEHAREIAAFINGPDVAGLDRTSALYPRALLVADIRESTFIANNHPDEIRYNVFQSLQYLADWLTGNGCVALPAHVGGVPVRVMDDLATAERSRWEVWHEIHHGRFAIEEFLKIAHEELLFIRKHLTSAEKAIQVKWDDRTGKWYPIAFQLMLLLMTRVEPFEFASELLLPFTVESIRNSQDPWTAVVRLEPHKYRLDDSVERLERAFSACGSVAFAKAIVGQLTPDPDLIRKSIARFGFDEVVHAAAFHGDIGEAKRTLDAVAAKEQSLVSQEDETTKAKLRQLGQEYLKRFGVKFLISAQGSSGQTILEKLQERLCNSPEQELSNAKTALAEIAVKRLSVLSDDDLTVQLAQHGVTGASICVTTSLQDRQTLCLGEAVRNKAAVTPATRFELASLSKSIASVFALEFFRERGISLDTPVNELLARTSSKFRLRSLDDGHPEWAHAVTLEHLMNHTALNLHYVNGVPTDQPMPNVAELLPGNAQFGYQAVGVLHAPGETFQYSGGGFLVLQHLLEAMAGRSVAELTRTFVEKLGASDFSFDPAPQSHAACAHGYHADGKTVAGSRLMFPAFAAGGMGSSADVAEFLRHLTLAYRSNAGSGPISHDTAVRCLHGLDKGSGRFMAAKMGLGIFTATAGTNRLALHQGANDGFRSLFVHCYDGPDRGKGFTILCNADHNGALFIADAAKILLKKLRIEGVDLDIVEGKFDQSGKKPEELVNLAYKDLIFAAFQPDRPEAISEQGPPDPLAEWNRAVGGRVLAVTDERFARAENLLSPFLPKFDPALYGRQGKIMDSWETARHNPLAHDEMIFRLKEPSPVRFVSLSTQFHLGNQAPAAEVAGRVDGGDWKTLVPKVGLDGHAIKYLRAEPHSLKFCEIRVRIHPDGGLSRLGLYADLPKSEQAKYQSVYQAISHPFADPVPQPLKPLAPVYTASREAIADNWRRTPNGVEVDVACEAFGGRIVAASNEHYGSAARLISAYRPVDMFDGFESARSRESGHYEHVTLALGKAARIHRLEIDFTFFKNNNPRQLRIEALSKSGWREIFPRTGVKAYAGNTLVLPVAAEQPLEQLRLTLYPDGGMNRVRAFCFSEPN